MITGEEGLDKLVWLNNAEYFSYIVAGYLSARTAATRVLSVVAVTSFLCAAIAIIGFSVGQKNRQNITTFLPIWLDIKCV